MKLWLDDVRPAPDGWTWIKSVEWAKSVFTASAVGVDFPITDISLDHDAGIYGGDYIEFLNYLERAAHESDKAQKLIEGINFHIHSMNPVGVENMRRIIKINGWKEVRSI